MIKKTRFLYETHMHTAPVSACAIISPAEQVHAYKKRGYAGIIVTDHFVNGNCACSKELPWSEKMEFFVSGFEWAKKAGDSCGLDVFFGLEYTINGADFLTYGISPDFLLKHPELQYMSIEEYSALIRKNGGYLAQAHPYRTASWIPCPYPADTAFLDGIETYNSSMPDEFNKKAFEFARLHNLPMQSGSDSHAERILFASGVALSQKGRNIFDIIEAIKTNQAELILPPRQLR